MIDMVLLMSVNPGFGGQKFIPSTLAKIRAVRDMTRGGDIDVEVDGGIDASNAGDVAAAGANWMVAGSSVFRDGPQHYARNIAAIRAAAEAARGERA
jgi:ribulose-phosphate 3-epimerase